MDTVSDMNSSAAGFVCKGAELTICYPGPCTLHVLAFEISSMLEIGRKERKAFREPFVYIVTTSEPTSRSRNERIRDRGDLKRER